MYKMIDETPLGDIPWSSFTLQYNGEKLTDNVPHWMDVTFQICYHDPRMVIHDMLGHPGFKDNMDYILYREYDPKTWKQQWQDVMLGDWAWMQAVHFFFLVYLVFKSIIMLCDRTKLHRICQHTGPPSFQ